MRRAARTAAASAALLFAAACATGGGTTVSASSGASASAPARVVLVEVRGKSAVADAFASRLLSEAEERGAGIVDARLAGAHLADLTDPTSEGSRKLRDAFPGTGYLAFEVGPCQTFRHSFQLTGDIDPMTGIRRAGEVVAAADVVCSASLSESGPDGKTKRSVSLEGRQALNGTDQPGEESDLDAARDAATQAAKKLFGRKK